jgi:hypothetical protein
MNSCLKYFSASLLALATQAAFAQVPDLGAASDFAVLSALTTSPGVVTCTDSTIDGDVGTASSNPLSVTQTNCTITGRVVTPVSARVLADFSDAYDALASNTTTPCDFTWSVTTFPSTPLLPGVHCFDAAVTAVSGSTLTLVGDSNATWLFKIGTLGTGALTGTDFSVVMEGGAQACNVTWWVKEAASMTRGAFNGTILAGAAIAFVGTAGTTVEETYVGRALAKAAVTLTDVAFVGCEGGSTGPGGGNSQSKCNQGVGNGPENCDPGNSNQDGHSSNPFDDARNTNDELGGTPGNPGRKGGNIK